jgi:hypothetical protein
MLEAQTRQADAIARLFEAQAANVAPKTEAAVAAEMDVVVPAPAPPTAEFLEQLESPQVVEAPEVAPREADELRRGDRILLKGEGSLLEEVGVVQITTGKIRIRTASGEDKWIGRDEIVGNLTASDE